MLHLSLQAHFDRQTDERRHDPGTSLGVPVAFLLRPEDGADFDFFERGMGALGPGLITTM